MFIISNSITRYSSCQTNSIKTLKASGSMVISKVMKPTDQDITTMTTLRFCTSFPELPQAEQGPQKSHPFKIIGAAFITG